MRTAPEKCDIYGVFLFCFFFLNKGVGLRGEGGHVVTKRICHMSVICISLGSSINCGKVQEGKLTSGVWTCKYRITLISLMVH